MIELKKCYCSVKVTIVYSLALYFRLCILFPVIGVFLCFIIHSLFYLHVHTLHNNYKKNSRFGVVVIAGKINIMSIDYKELLYPRMFTKCTRQIQVDTVILISKELNS